MQCKWKFIHVFALSRGSINIAEVVHTEHARKQKVMLTLGGRAGQLLIARLVACRLGVCMPSILGEDTNPHPSECESV